MAPEALKMVANKNVEQIAKLESEQVEARTLSERIAGRDDDRIAGGDCSIDDDPDWPEPDEPAGGSRQYLGLQVTLLAEQESTAILPVRQIAERLGVSVVNSDQALASETNLDQLVSGPARRHDGRITVSITRQPAAPASRRE